MKLSIKGMALSFGILWGGAILLVGIAQQISPGYGATLLEMASSIYPGYEVGGFGSAIVGALYGFVDGLIGGAIFAWLYNRFSGRVEAAGA